MSEHEFENDDDFLRQIKGTDANPDDVDRFHKIIESLRAENAALKERAEKDMQAEYNERCRLQNIINGFCEGLSCKEPETHEEASAIGDRKRDEAVKSERERCAKIVEEGAIISSSDEIAAAIRSGEEKANG